MFKVFLGILSIQQKQKIGDVIKLVAVIKYAFDVYESTKLNKVLLTL